MNDPIGTYRRLVLVGRVNAVFFLGFGAALFFLNEERASAFHLMLFLLFALSGWGMFVFGFYVRQYAKKHGIEHWL